MRDIANGWLFIIGQPENQFYLQRSLTCLSVTNQHKLELSQRCDRQAGKTRVLPGIGKWPRGLTHSTTHVVAPSLVCITLHPFFFSLYLSKVRILLVFSLGGPNTYLPWCVLECFLDPSPGCSNRKVRGTPQTQERCCAPTVIRGRANSSSTADPVLVHWIVLLENKPLQEAINLSEEGQ